VSTLLGRIGVYGRMIKFSHSVFALPFALSSAVIAAGRGISWRELAWILVAMVGARSAAMGFNRLADQRLDARNPRTAGRELPRGALSRGEVWLFVMASAATLVVAAAMLNPLCLALAPLALVFLVGYSYTKRFTWASHWILGFTDGIAAAGGWIAVRGAFEPPALVLWLALTVWIAGFDLIYACQDVDVDRAQGLRSVPARFGVVATLRLARLNHALTALALAWLGAMMSLGVFYWIGWLAVVALLVYEHSLVRPDDLSRLNVAFFNVNGYIAVIVLMAVATGLWR
jgi:4-hydroxybenzoate polyprenyltransferase